MGVVASVETSAATEAVPVADGRAAGGDVGGEGVNERFRARFLGVTDDMEVRWGKSEADGEEREVRFEGTRSWGREQTCAFEKQTESERE